MNIPINQREKWSPFPSKEPETGYEDMGSHNEPTPNAFSKATFEPIEEIVLPETIKEVNVSYVTLIALSAFLIILGAILGTMATLAVYGDAIARGKLMYETDDMIKQVQYNTDQIRDKVNANAAILPKINENIERLGAGIVEELKPKEAKIVNQ